MLAVVLYTHTQLAVGDGQDHALAGCTAHVLAQASVTLHGQHQALPVLHGTCVDDRECHELDCHDCLHAVWRPTATAQGSR